MLLILISLLQGNTDAVVILASIVGLITGILPISEFLRGRLVKDRRVSPENYTNATIEMYLRGRVVEFEDEERYFISLSGNVSITNQFEVLDKAFPETATGQLVKTFDDISEVTLDYKRFILVGDPGAGKTTVLRRLVVSLARQYIQSDGHEGLLPFWISLDKHDGPKRDATKLLQYWWHDIYNLESDPLTYLNNRRLFLFFDGLNDGLESFSDKQERIDSLVSFLKAYPDAPIIISSRTHEYLGKLELELPVVRLMPLDDMRIRNLVVKRLGDTEMFEKISENVPLIELARNPYNLTMLIYVYSFQHDLPADLNSLYADFLKYRFKDYSSRHLLHLKWDQLEQRLQSLAFLMLKTGKGTHADINWVRRQIGNRAISDAVNLGVLVYDARAVRFYHQSLQSFFALPLLSRALQHTNSILDYGFGKRLDLIKTISNLGSAAAPAVPALIELLEDPITPIRLAAIEALGEIGELIAPAGPILANLLDDKDKNIRWAAALALGKLGLPSSSSVALLEQLLRDGNREARKAAADALAKIGDAAAPAVPTLINLLDDPNMPIRLAAIEALSKIGDAAAPAVPTLIDFLDDQNPTIRLASATAVGELHKHSVSAFSDLVRLLNDPVQEIRFAAANSLAVIGIPTDNQPLPTTNSELEDLEGLFTALQNMIKNHSEEFNEKPALRICEYLSEKLGLKIIERDDVSTLETGTRVAITVGDQKIELYVVFIDRPLWKMGLPDKIPLVVPLTERVSMDYLRRVPTLLAQAGASGDFALLVAMGITPDIDITKPASVVLLLKEDIISKIATSTYPLESLQRIVANRADIQIISPYESRGPIDPLLYFGRTDELEKILRNIRRKNYFLVGKRRAGKTSTLHLIKQHFAKLGVTDVILISSSLESVTDEYTLRQEIQEKCGLEVPDGPIGRSLVSIFDEYARRQGAHVVILWDEADRIIDYDSNHDWPIFRALRDATLVPNPSFTILITGFLSLYKGLHNGQSPLFNFGPEIILNQLSQKASVDLIVQPLNTLGIEVSDSLAEKIYIFTSGDPALIQFVCSEIIQTLQQADNSQRLVTNELLETIFASDIFAIEYLEATYGTFLPNLLRLIILCALRFDSQIIPETDLIKAVKDFVPHTSIDDIQFGINVLCTYMLKKQKSKLEWRMKKLPQILRQTRDYQLEIDTLLEKL
ncbi:MAG: HEAT repeat domain-containing protein [Anaerolineae bacterium]|nr:HEAT repeat domain-containing protein [Anaerolineae bacterium]